MPSLGALVLMLVVAPSCLAVLLGIVETQTAVRQIFRCVRCHRAFLRKPHLPFAASCPLCGARDWNHPSVRA